MNILTKLRIWNIRRKLTPEQRKAFDKKITIAILRAELAFWGIDTTDMTDDEIEAAVVRFAKIVASTGISAQQAADNLRAVLGSN